MKEIIYEDLLHNISKLKQFNSFFIKHQEAFIYSFKQTFKKNEQNISFTQIEKKLDTLYKSIFINSSLDVNNTLSELSDINIYNINFKKALTNGFFVLLNHFIKFLYNKDNDFKNIKLLTETIDAIFYFLEIYNQSNTFILDTQTEIITKIEKMRQNGEKLTLFNTYKGVPIQNDAKIIHTTPNNIILKTDPIQEIAALNQKNVYILQNKYFQYALNANIEKTIIKNNNLLVLSNLEFLKHSMRQRQSVRVSPKSALKAILSFDNERVNTTLFDISIGGLSLICRDKVHFQRASTAKITIALPGISEHININTKFLYNAKFEKNYKYQFKTIFNTQEEKIISKYISTRQLQIIKELKEKTL